jgi:hypothetical protein
LEADEDEEEVPTGFFLFSFFTWEVVTWRGKEYEHKANFRGRYCFVS